MRGGDSRAAMAVAGGALTLLVLAGTAVGAAPRGTSYGGSGTNQDAVVVLLSQDGRRVTKAAVVVDGVCDFGDRPTFVIGSRSPVPVAPNGTFTTTTDGTASVEGRPMTFRAVVKGTVTGMRIRGTATVTADVVAPDGTVSERCSGASRFTAVSQPGRVFAGVTSQQAPVVAELVPSGIRVKHFHIGWSAGCTENRTFSIGDTITNFSVVRGRFGDRWTYNSTQPDGSRLSLQYTVRGRITGARATGTFRLQLLATDSSGAQRTCDTGVVTYRASSG